ncbi:MAG TPA: hypothetical protein VIM06_01575 [Rhodanobacter sp.]
MESAADPLVESRGWDFSGSSAGKAVSCFNQNTVAEEPVKHACDGLPCSMVNAGD